ncbi:MAG: MFS transporter [Planctomycetes bacterium]|nr:MFS transporter [Planctomycetota bacterium]
MVLAALTVSHLLNDLMQSVVVAIYPLLKDSFHLTFSQIGAITLANQVTASLLQPLIGLYTDRRPMPYSLAIGMGSTMAGMLLLAAATSFAMLLAAAALIGTGSAVFHPEASRLARIASGGRHGLAQSVFQVGGNLGSSLGPLLAALVIIPRGYGAIRWCAVGTLAAMVILIGVGSWYRRHRQQQAARAMPAESASAHLSPARVAATLGILGLLVFSKYVYLAGLTNFYTFYLIDHFHVSTRSAQLHLFAFLFAIAAGTIIGGPIGDRIGRKRVIWASILGVAPFTIALPHADLFWTGVLSVPIGLILASAFSAILVYAQELVPGKVGMVSGLFFGFAFGVAGIAAAALGAAADRTSIEHVFAVCAFLPLIGVVTAFLPDLSRPR